MRTLPSVTTLQQAVMEVIKSNTHDGYPPRRFVQATEDGYAEGLLQICERLIGKGETLEYIEQALLKYPTLLTLEDLVAVHGAEWGFSSSTIRSAQERASYFDRLVGQPRYTEHLP